MLTVMDVLPTMLDLADVDESIVNSSGQKVLPIRGKSFASLLHNTDSQVHSNDEYIALDHAGHSWLTEGDWKILRVATEEDWQLYNVSNDPRELDNLATTHKGKLLDLVQKFQSHANQNGIIKR